LRRSAPVLPPGRSCSVAQFVGCGSSRRGGKLPAPPLDHSLRALQLQHAGTLTLEVGKLDCESSDLREQLDNIGASV